MLEPASDCSSFLGRITFPCVNEPHLVYLPPTDGRMGCFHRLVIANDAAVNMGV